MLSISRHLIEVKYQWYWHVIIFIFGILSYSYLFFQYVYMGELVHGENTHLIEELIFNFMIIALFLLLTPLAIYQTSLHVIMDKHCIQYSRFYGISKENISFREIAKILTKKDSLGNIYLVEFFVSERRCFGIYFFCIWIQRIASFS